ncbi:hypothetical protein EIP86_010739 [Pleurotus ostreatoroseus]|nr:hypothetical protein EIP86_010739 [Pleurotus ostreatoroseus]
MSAAGMPDSWDFPEATGSRLPQKRVAEPVKDDWDDDDDEEEEEEDPQKVWEDAHGPNIGSFSRLCLLAAWMHQRTRHSNTKAPMPEFVISSQGATASVLPPPPAAFQPALRILKRPAAASPAASASAAAADAAVDQQRRFAEREAQYQAARERIFGDSGAAASSATASPPPSGSTSPSGTARAAGMRVMQKDAPAMSTRQADLQTPPAASVIRNPRGPDDVPEGQASGRGGASARGFRGRRGANSNSNNSTSRSAGQGPAK